ncbi:YolD-like family protein [Paenibacillus sp. WQ 127069]|uniref:YolD-like family protein n=1 Tax=Paenibacillus baimaensis TaxID=2982185 RepID=A0ABT2UNB0_9BACL|nr:YolD-like family protein [Paenibacillus sp. WQ 127069]MCU6795144.1 YolD-like family protein [Paenibacillus sp. WQ 127069]
MSKLAKSVSKNAIPKRPTRDEFELEELGEKLVEAQRENQEVLLTIWAVTEQVRGLITNMDARTRMVHIQKYGNLTKVPFLDNWKVECPGS